LPGPMTIVDTIADAHYGDRVKMAFAFAALLNEELTETELKEMAVFLTHYLGFPLGSALNGAVDSVVAKRKKAAAKGAGEDKKANVEGALKMHSGE